MFSRPFRPTSTSCPHTAQGGQQGMEEPCLLLQRIIARILPCLLMLGIRTFELWDGTLKFYRQYGGHVQLEGELDLAEASVRKVASESDKPYGVAVSVALTEGGTREIVLQAPSKEDQDAWVDRLAMEIQTASMNRTFGSDRSSEMM